MYKIELENKKIKPRVSVTDISKWLPNVKALNTAEVVNTSTPKPALFPDGKDNGIRLYDVTNAKDITRRIAAQERLKKECVSLENTIKEMINEELDNIGSTRNPQEPSVPQAAAN